MGMIGIDIGSISVKVVVVDRAGEVVHDQYFRHKARPFEVARNALKALFQIHEIECLAATGSGAKTFASLVGASFVNEIVAVTRGIDHLHPQVRSAIDIGGEDSKLIWFEKGEGGESLQVKDFSMNGLCAAGTGAFLDQQASRLCFSIEEFSEIALRSKAPPRIAGRCTVFAKSDMIHLQQTATPDYEVVAGLCYALARNFKGNIAKGRSVVAPVAFIGGVAANAGMRKALQDVFSLEDAGFVVPEHYASVGAIGAVCAVTRESSTRVPFRGLDGLDEYLAERKPEEGHEPLALSETNRNVSYEIRKVSGKTTAYLGVDVGSISTNLVAVDEDHHVLAKRYLMTEGRPLEAVKKGLAEIGEEIAEFAEIVGAGTTGSGRYLTGDFIGADIVRNEITSQAEAAIDIDPDVDTIFEIGGQDSKYISIKNGAIVDFEMNKACAAGTGSFLEEQAERLDISIKEEFGRLALASKKPVKMGERCTVFIESDVVHNQQRGARTEDIVGGLSYSIVSNYLNKVVGDKRIGTKVFFQGGTAFNQGVVAAFEKILGMPIRVPPHHDVTGAIGVAMLAMKERNWEVSSFKGFDLSKRRYEISTFECSGCENLCEIRKVTVEGETPLYYGSRCEKYDVLRKTRRQVEQNLFEIREQALHAAYDRKVQGEPIGIPMILNTHDLLPFWKAFLSELGFSVILSDATNKKTIREGAENIIVETCFPIKLAHGHILNLIGKGLNRVFIPSVINLAQGTEGTLNTFACPYAQSIPYTARASIDFEGRGVRVDAPIVYFGRGREQALQNLIQYGKTLKRSKKEVRKAFDVAMEAQEIFYRRCSAAGFNALSEMGDQRKGMVIIGRPYNSADPGANLNIHKKLIDLGVMPIPLDMLPLTNGGECDEDLKNMYWGYGQKILRAAEFIRNRHNLHGIYITSFGCGPDSFITHFFKRVIGDRAFLQLEIDEHSADAGVVTRLEAFLDSVKNARAPSTNTRRFAPKFGANGGGRKIYIPNMADHSRALESVFKACGVQAEVMEESDDQTLYWGRKYTSGKECYPCILTTGDMVKVVKKEGFNRTKSAFFMPSGAGPCRFGQYNRFHRMVLEEMGFHDVPIYSPIQDHRLYQDLNLMGGRFSRLGWRAIVATDMITKMLHQVRPYEIVTGESDSAYKQSLAAICETLEQGQDGLRGVLEDSISRFRKVKITKERKPIVGVVGEIYIRSNRFSNNDLVRRIEEFGGEAWLAPISEWISYLNYVTKRNGLRKAGFGGFMQIMVTDYVQHRDERFLESIFGNWLNSGAEPKTDRIIEKASPYIDVSFEGEAILSVGKAADFIDNGVSGIINAMPFTCMPGTISSAVMRLLQNKYHAPIISVAYDGQSTTNITTRLEAFMYQVKEYFNRQHGSSGRNSRQ
jgi:predicted CoA-substrate-specific enzyme activase